MRFAPALTAEAERFIRDVIKQPYIAAHMRRSDYVLAHRSAVPSIPNAVEQLQVSTIIPIKS